MLCVVKGCKNKAHHNSECSRHMRFRLYGRCKNNCPSPANAKHGYCSRCVSRNNAPPESRKLGIEINNKFQRYCWSCKETKPPKEFSFSSGKYRSICKNCVILRVRGYDRDAIMDYYKKDGVAMCMKCQSTSRLEVDHVVPLSWGGTNDISNLQVLCRSCNATKLNKNANDYRKVQ